MLSDGGDASGRRQRRRHVPWQQLVDAFGLIVGNAGRRGVPRDRAAQARRAYQVRHRSRAFAASVGAGEQECRLLRVMPRSARSAIRLSISARPSLQ